MRSLGGLALLPQEERGRHKPIVQACHRWQRRRGPAKVLGLGSRVSSEEEALLEGDATTLGASKLAQER